MCGNTRPKLLEVSCGRTSQHSKGLLTISSLFSLFTEYHTHLERARHSGFQTLDVEYRTDSRCPLDQTLGTTTETDEDGDRRRRRQAKTETDEDKDRRRRIQTKTGTVNTKTDEDGDSEDEDRHSGDE